MRKIQGACNVADKNLNVAGRERKARLPNVCIHKTEKKGSNLSDKKLRFHPCPSSLVFQSFKQDRENLLRASRWQFPFRFFLPSGRKISVSIAIDKSFAVSARILLFELAAIKIADPIINLRSLTSFVKRLCIEYTAVPWSLEQEGFPKDCFQDYFEPGKSFDPGLKV